MKLKFFVTTPIYYVNDVPHIGNAYTTIAADILAMWNRILGNEVFFLTGLDENSIKTVKAAKEKGITNLHEYTDSMAKTWKDAWSSLKISNNDFIRTTEDRHKKTVLSFFKKIFDNDDIYKGTYEGLYCEGCEQFYTEKDLENGLCPFHKKTPKKITEKNYFFKLSKYQKPLIEYIENNPNFIKPESRRNEVISFIKEDLHDVSISRPHLEWGIDLPIDSNHKFWVWFDALINYISANPSQWPATVQIVGKDILRFHCVIWPAMLMSAGYQLPETIFVHGFFTIDGQKISKSLGNAVDPIELSKKHGLDAVRYFLFREIPFGSDGDFSDEAVVQRKNSDLADNLGNLVNRVLVLVERYFDSSIPKFVAKDNFVKKVSGLPERVENLMENFQFHNALSEIWQTIAEANKYINETKPWKIKNKEKLGNILYNLMETLRYVAILIYPFMPETAEKIMKQLGLELRFSFKDLTWGGLREGKKIRRGNILFTKLQN